MERCYGHSCMRGGSFPQHPIDNCTARMKWQHLLGSAWLVTLVAGFINIVFLMHIR